MSGRIERQPEDTRLQSSAQPTPVVPPGQWIMGNQRPHRCPVCEGRGSVPAGFYSAGLATGTNGEQCRACKGEGVLWR